MRPWSTTLEASPNRSPPSTSHNAAPYVAHVRTRGWQPRGLTVYVLRACPDGGALSWQPGPRVLAPHERHSSQHQRSVRRRARGLHGRSLNCDRCGRRTQRTGANVLITRTGQVKLAGSSAILETVSAPIPVLTSSPERSSCTRHCTHTDFGFLGRALLAVTENALMPPPYWSKTAGFGACKRAVRALGLGSTR